jgi:hypothetical protein
MDLPHPLPNAPLQPGEEVWAFLENDRPERLIATDRRVIRVRPGRVESWALPELSDLRPLGKEGRFGIVRRDGSIVATMKIPDRNREAAYQAITVIALLIARAATARRRTHG